MIYIIENQGKWNQRIWDLYPSTDSIVHIIKPLTNWHSTHAHITINLDWTWSDSKNQALKYRHQPLVP